MAAAATAEEPPSTCPSPPPKSGPISGTQDAEPTIPGRTLNLDTDQIPVMRACLAGKEYDAALALAETVLAERPNDLEARECQLRSQMALEAEYLRNIGSFEQVPRLAVSAVEICGLSLDNRTGFLLSRIDGVSTLQTILHISGMSNVEALRSIDVLLKKNIITLEARR